MLVYFNGTFDSRHLMKFNKSLRSWSMHYAFEDQIHHRFLFFNRLNSPYTSKIGYNCYIEPEEERKYPITRSTKACKVKCKIPIYPLTTGKLPSMFYYVCAKQSVIQLNLYRSLELTKGSIVVFLCMCLLV